VQGEWFAALTSGAHGTERERGPHLRGVDADRSAPPGRGREGGRARGCRLALIGGSHLSGERTRARLTGPSWAVRAELGFSIFLNFEMTFLFVFSMEFNSNSNNSNMCIKQKE
jgi:hypothetical protein